MHCTRCNTGFCWSCMETDKVHDSRCGGFAFCPRLPYSMCVNLLITVIAFILCPIFMILGPIIFSVYLSLYQVPRELKSKFKYDCDCGRCAAKFWAYLIGILLTPIFLALAIPVSALLLVFGTLAFWFCCVAYLCILTKNICK